jgi:hypothetical protein
MASRKKGDSHLHDAPVPSPPAPVPQKPARPLIFVSHDHRDAKLAEAFANLLTDASGGFLKSFRSSDRKGGSGIEFGREWYGEIMDKIHDATDVVALLTQHSINRPWLLYEAGVAKGKLDKQVLGLVIGVPFETAIRGPFAQFHNSENTEDSVTKLVLELICRNSEAEPRPEAVRDRVKVFRESLKTLGAEEETEPSDPAEAEANAVAKLFEEIKVMFRELPVRLQGQLSDSLGPRFGRRRPFHPMMLMDMMRHLPDEDDRATSWLMLISSMRDDAPWLYEMGVEVYHAARTGDQKKLASAVATFERSLRMLRHGPMMEPFMESKDMHMIVHELPHVAHRFFEIEPPLPSKGKAKEIDGPDGGS